jgi:hypothetical protein
VYEPAVNPVPRPDAPVFELYEPIDMLPVPVSPGGAGASDARLSVTPVIDQPAFAILEGVAQYLALATTMAKSFVATVPSHTSVESGCTVNVGFG